VRRPILEKPIHTFAELIQIIEALDLDEGIRILGCFKNLRGGGFIFVTTVHTASELKYCVNVAERIYNNESGIYLPGGKETFLYFSDSEETYGYVERHAARPLQAWCY
jgi:hypothetical protein